MNPAYAELHALSNFSFLRGASHPHELIKRAHDLGYTALALTDECSFAGLVRAHQQAKELNFQLILGCEIHLTDGPKLVLLVENLVGYQTLCRLVSQGRRRADKGHYQLHLADLGQPALPGCLAIWLPGPRPDASWAADLKARFGERLWLGVELHRGPDDTQTLARSQQLGRAEKIPLLACGGVHMHCRSRRVLQDTLTAIRHGCSLDKAGKRLFPNGERHLRSRRNLARLYPPELLAETVKVARRCHFSLDQLRYRYPDPDLPPGMDANAYLRQLTEAGLRAHWPDGVPGKVRKLVNKELALIRELDYPQYFLTVHAIMRWARESNILCQGRGSAANSAVCFALGITVVNPAESATLFERFVSRERREPPDIDVDFEHQRREEVFQHIYREYGREHAALAATVIRYRPKSAIRDVGKALGLPLADLNRITSALAWWDGMDSFDERLREIGFDPSARRLRLLTELVAQLQRFPRHLSQHVGGFVICATPLDQLVPIENAAMPERTVLQWDKDDLDALEILKVDCLALGMLTAIHKAFALVAGYRGAQLSIPGILRSDAEQGREARQVYSMLGQGQSVGVFQVESRAQMAMLPRMRPQCLYDLTIETAIVRPGPIQGGMVHPYLNRRMGREPVTCPPGLQGVLGRTFGVPIFQEQVMEICVVGAGFAPGEADQVRRSMAAWGRYDHDSLGRFEARLKQGMAANGYSAEFADAIFQQIRGFAEYGFPESHAASFAVLVYVSAWLKRFEPAALLAGLLNSQPMGFYSPHQLIQDFRRTHGVTVRPVDVRHSAWETTLETQARGQPAVRLGLNRVKGLDEAAAGRIVARRGQSRNVAELRRQAGLDARQLRALAAADALQGLAGSRHQAHWQTQVPAASAALPEARETAAALPDPSEGEDIVADFASLACSLRRHPMALLRPHFSHCLAARQWRQLGDRRACRVAGLVTNRQRPGTAKGIIFMTLEDETGQINLVIQAQMLERYRAEVLSTPLVEARGINQERDGVRHLLVRELRGHAALLGDLITPCRDFH